MKLPLWKPFTLVALLVLSACSTHYSSLKGESDEQTLYQLEEAEAFSLAQAAMLQVLPGRDITNIDGKTKGYSTWFRFALDTYTQQILVIPISGITSDGTRVDGYYFDVSGSGSSFVQGRAKNVSLWNTLVDSLEETNTKRVVQNVESGEYTFGGPFVGRDTVVSAQTETLDNLERLKTLHAEGVLTDQEFDNQKQKMLETL